MEKQSKTSLPAEFVADVIDHMNTDHVHNLRDYAVVFGSVDWADQVCMQEMTVAGFSLLCQSNTGREELIWVKFEPDIKRPEQVRGVLVAMAKQAKKTIGGEI